MKLYVLASDLAAVQVHDGAEYCQHRLIGIEVTSLVQAILEWVREVLLLVRNQSQIIH